MSSVLKISEAASLALHTVCLLAAAPRERFTTRALALELRVSETHLSKVVQRLAKAGYVRSVRGPKGGVELAPGKDGLTLLEVFEAIEGPIETRACLLDTPACDGRCILGSWLDRFDRGVREYLAKTKVSDVSMRFQEAP